MNYLWFSPLESDLALLLWGVFLGAILALLYLLLLRGRTSRTVERILAGGCTDEASALPAEKLGLSPAALKRAGKGAAASVVRVLPDPQGDRAYVPEEKRRKAEYLAGKLRWKWWQFVLAVIALYAVMIGAHAVLPLFLG